MLLVLGNYLKVAPTARVHVRSMTMISDECRNMQWFNRLHIYAFTISTFSWRDNVHEKVFSLLVSYRSEVRILVICGVNGARNVVTP